MVRMPEGAIMVAVLGGPRKGERLAIAGSTPVRVLGG